MRKLTLSLVTVFVFILAALIGQGLGLAQNDSTPSQAEPVPGQVPGSAPATGQPGRPTEGVAPKNKKKAHKAKAPPKSEQSNQDL